MTERLFWTSGLTQHHHKGPSKQRWVGGRRVTGGVTVEEGMMGACFEDGEGGTRS